MWPARATVGRQPSRCVFGSNPCGGIFCDCRHLRSSHRSRFAVADRTTSQLTEAMLAERPRAGAWSMTDDNDDTYAQHRKRFDAERKRRAFIKGYLAWRIANKRGMDQ